MMGWQEISRAKNLSHTALVQYWNGAGEPLTSVLERGYAVILSQLAHNQMYLNYPLDVLSIEDLYNDFLCPDGLTRPARIKGVEACMWCHPQRDLEFLLWPRLLVTTEFGWYGDQDKNLPQFLQRCEKTVDLLRQLTHIDTGPIYPPYRNRAAIARPDTF